jgi:hypothetical protein
MKEIGDKIYRVTDKPVRYFNSVSYETPYDGGKLYFLLRIGDRLYATDQKADRRVLS